MPFGLGDGPASDITELANGIIDPEVVEVKRLTVLVIVAVLLAGLILLGLNDSSISIADIIIPGKEATTTTVPTTTGIPARLSGSLAGEIIAFVSDRDGNEQIYVMNADGSDQRRATHSSTDCVEPSWSPDGRRIAYSVEWEDFFTKEIYVIDADGSNQRLIFKTSYSAGDPAWSPDGSLIAFVTSDTPTHPGLFTDIAVMNHDGANFQFIKYPWGSNSEDPAWSPDGKQIAFSGGGESWWYIVVMNADGTNLRNLTEDISTTHETWSPAWSPDGQFIAFSAWMLNGTGLGLYIMNADGSNPRLLIAGGLWPTWSPDGKHIAFAYTLAGNTDIYVVDVDGSNLRRLTTSPGLDYDPTWIQGEWSEDEPSPEVGFAGLIAQGKLVIAYNFDPFTTVPTAVAGWTWYDPTLPPSQNNLAKLHKNTAYWVKVTEECWLTYGTKTYHLAAGWNNPVWLGC